MKNKSIIVGIIILACLIALAVFGVIFVNKQIDTARDEGYKQGHSAGYTEGQNLGFSNGKKAGYDEGYQVGKDEGYDIGYNEGYDTCAALAVEGIELAYKEGYQNGVYNTGMSVLDGIGKYLQGF